MINIVCKKLLPEARLPIHSTEMAAGYDLFTYEEHILAPGEYHLYKTGIAMAIPDGIYGRIAPRSGLAFKNGIDVLAGVIDADYRDEVGIILVNHGNQHWSPPKYDKGENAGKLKPIAQMIFEYYNYADIFEAASLPPPESSRKGGFGHTDDIQSKKTDPHSTLTELYTKVGGINIKERYIDEVKKRQS